MANAATIPNPFVDLPGVRAMAPELLLQEMRSDVPLVVIDVREREDVARGTVDTARSFPLRWLGSRLAELAGIRDRHIVLVSNDGRSARAAASLMCLRGFEDVHVLEGGVDRWTALGYPLTTVSLPPGRSAPHG